MGNQLALPQKLPPDPLSELSTVVLKDSLGGGRFLKTLLCVHDDGGLVVVKVYYKRPDSPQLEPYRQQLISIRNRLAGLECPHVWPYQAFVETPSAGYMIRQYMFANLYDRLSTRPFLTNIEKRWIAWQLLHAAAQCHERDVCHGDIKCENVLVTSWNWVFLVDFACYKPSFLPADNPSDYSFFFDTGGRRRCYIAPERFYEGSAPGGVSAQAPLTPEMDIFSLGCVIAELFLDGKAFLDLSQLLSYRRLEYDPIAMLTSVDADIARLVLHMIQLNPADRWRARDYLTSWQPAVFAPYFEEPLHPFFNSLLAMDNDARMAAVHDSFPALKQQLLSSHFKADQRRPVLSTDGAMDGDTLPSSLELSQERPAEPAREEPEFLADVSTLLEDASRLVRRLNSRGRAGPSPQLEEDPGFLLDDGDEPDGPGGIDSTGSNAMPRPSSEGIITQVDEVVTDEWFEYETCDQGRWAADISLATGASGASAKETMALPAEGGWQWAGDWRLDARGATDPDGWHYRQTAKPGWSTGGWGPSCSEDCLRRRRRWVRQRRRKVTAGAVGPPPTALAQQDAPAGLAPTGLPGPGVAGKSGESGGAEGLVLLVVLMCTLLRGSRLVESKRAAILLLADAAPLCDDDTRLQCVVPYLLTLIVEPAASVRALALRCVVAVMCTVQVIPPAESKVFRDYLLPSLSLLPNDPEEVVRVEYALGMSALAAAAHQHLLNAHQETADPNAAGSPLVKYDSEIGAMRTGVEKVVLDLVTGARTTAPLKRALLSHVKPLALFFGRRDLNDLLLPMLITCLNGQEWQLRSAFFEAIASIAGYTGRDALDAFIQPCLEQALIDPEPSVVSDALRVLAGVARHMRRRTLITAAQKVAPLLHHYHAGVRCSALSFMAAVARVLPPADVYTQVVLVLSPLLDREPLLLSDEKELAAALKPAPAVRSAEEQESEGAAPGSAGSPPAPLGLLDSGLMLQPRSQAGMRKTGSLSTLGTPPRPGSEPVERWAVLAASPPRQGSRKLPMSTSPSQDGLNVRSGASGSPMPGATTSGDEGDSVMVLRPPAPVYTIDTPAAPGWSGSASLHSIAMEGIPAKERLIEERVQALRERMNRDPQSVDAVEWQQYDRLTHTLSRLQARLGEDVRCDSTLTTFRLTQLAARITAEPAPAPTARLATSLAQPSGGPSAASGTSGSPGISDAVAAALSTGIPLGTVGYGGETSDVGWRPRGVLVAHLFEHRKSINKLAISRNGAFAVSASNDETVKVWDLRRLEKDVSFHSRLTYAAQPGRILSVTACEDDQSIASASAAGSVHVWRVEYTTRSSGAPDRYSGILGVRQMAGGEGAVLEVAQWGGLLLYVTQRGGVHGWDLRMKADAWTLPMPPGLGLSEHLVTDPVGSNWLLLGTSRGYLALWDVRFQLRVNSFQHPMRCGVDSLAVSVCPPSRLGLRGLESSGPLVYVSAGLNEVGLWDVASSRCHQVLRVLGKEEGEATSPTEPGSLRGRDGEGVGDGSTTSLDINAAPPQGNNFTVRTLISTSGGPMLTAGGDRCVRYWDAASPERSYMVCGPMWPDSLTTDQQPTIQQMPQFVYQYSHRMHGDVPVVEEHCLPGGVLAGDIGGSEQRLKMRMNDQAHADAVTHMLLADTGSSRLLLSASRDGCLKAWK